MTLDGILEKRFYLPIRVSTIIRQPRIFIQSAIRFTLDLKRYDNRLLFDRQIKVSEMLGFEGDGNRGVEKMMKRFFQALRTISRLTDILIKHYKEHFFINRWRALYSSFG